MIIFHSAHCLPATVLKQEADGALALEPVHAAAGQEHDAAAEPAAAGQEHDAAAEPAVAGQEHDAAAEPAAAGQEHDAAAEPAAAGQEHDAAAEPAAAGGARADACPHCKRALRIVDLTARSLQVQQKHKLVHVWSTPWIAYHPEAVMAVS